MRKKIIYFFLFITLFCLTNIHSRTGITNKVTYGRFGDNVFHYLKSKYLAHKYNLEFYFQTFKRSDKLEAYHQEKFLSENICNSFKKHISVFNESDIVANLKDGNLLIVEPYLKGFDFNTEDFINYLLFNEADNFVEKAKFLLKPTKAITLLQLPNKISVALHIRKPSGHDRPLFSLQEFEVSLDELTENIIDLEKNELKTMSLMEEVKSFQKNKVINTFGIVYSDTHENALKFPPNQFYIDQIKKLSNFFNDLPMYVYLFTDDLNPHQLCEIMKKGVNKANITFATNVSNFSSHVIEDYYLMSQFDCLIKSISTFSSIAQLIGNHAITIFPSDFFWDDKKLIINRSTWLVRKKQLNKLLG